VAVNDTVYFVPYFQDNIGVLGTVSRNFTTINTTGVTENFKYLGAVAVNGMVYFVPYHQNNVGVLDTGCPA